MGILADRFTEFCRSLPGAEEIDGIQLASHQQQLGLKRADFLFEERSVICEIKSLESDTAPKFVAFLEQEGFSLSPGEYNVGELFSARPNASALWNRAINIVSTAVADGLADANKQIRDTRKLFGISGGDGVVVILNGMVEVLGPQLVITRIQQRLQRLKADETSYHGDVALVVYFSEKHVRDTGGGDAAVAFPIRNQLVEAHTDLNGFTTRLVGGWAKHNGRWFEEQAWDLGM